MVQTFPLVKSVLFQDGEVQAVRVLDLYEFLGLDKSNFSKWVDKTILKNEYAVEGEDYILQHGQEYESRNYILTIEFAKKVSMRSNSKKGEEVRKYFIECEKKIKAPVRTYEVVMREALLLADQKVIEQQQHIDKLEDKIYEDRPKVSFANAVAGSVSSVNVGDWIKTIQSELHRPMGRTKAFQWLRDEGYLMKGNVPYQNYIDMKIFEVKEQLITTTHGSKIQFTTLVTGKGQLYLLDKLRRLDIMPTI